ncbi:MAG TPA: 50S ribosomal protein L21e [Candidatus Nanoarchaeia archaeon]|nr:50S ribosomal protein L21e [Candidatus Nanoarchaeia archaeon]
MVTKGFRSNTRRKLAKSKREKGKISITRFYQKFNEGEKVYLVAEPAYQNGMYHPRFHGKSGSIINKRGKCYEVEIKDGNAKKLMIVHPVHLKRT